MSFNRSAHSFLISPSTSSNVGLIKGLGGIRDVPYSNHIIRSLSLTPFGVLFHALAPTNSVTPYVVDFTFRTSKLSLKNPVST